MVERETSQGIDDTAAAWVAKMDRGPLSAPEAEMLRVWLAGDARRQGALLRAKAVFLRSESARALGPHYDPVAFGAEPEPLPVVRFTRRRLLGWSAAAAASVATVGILGAVLPVSRAYATETGEMRLVPLDDGSTVLLNTATKVRVGYSQARRFVRLLRGEAFFAASLDAHRPFVVEVDGRRLSTAGAAFAVRKLDAAPVQVLVHDGSVGVAGAGAPATSLGANTRLLMPAASEGRAGAMPAAASVEPVSSEDMARELAWREGRIAFRGESLAEAATAFTRYSDTRILVADPELAREPITGLFVATDPAGFSRAIAGMFDAQVDADGGIIVVSRPAAGY